jgi:L-seryl-tRNA(Ser) seleniumtransferase
MATEIARTQPVEALNKMPDLRSLPSVDLLLQDPLVLTWIETYGRPITLEALRVTLDQVRQRYPSEQKIPTKQEITANAQQLLDEWTSPSLQAVLNASGVILHTNLGRAPLSQDAVQAMHDAATGYSNLEFDLASGRRGSRLVHAEDLLKRLTGAGAALVVNNNAAAVLLILSALAHRRRVVLARSQMVEIGGGFRVPDVMKQSGAKLVEIGTTNRVHLSDYEQAITAEPIALVLRAHRSNFRIIGFTSEPTLKEIVQVAHAAGLPVVDDLGSGSFMDTTRFGMGPEPTVQESLEAGADLVCFSADKLLGGPQAGIIIGRPDLIAKLKKHPLARAIRVDKLCLAALSATLLHYLKDQAVTHVPIWRMISTPAEILRNRTQGWISHLGQGEIKPGLSTVGGGSLPGETIPTYLFALDVPNPNRFLAHLRSSKPPVIARIEDERVVLDPRTILPEQDPVLLTILERLLRQNTP